MIAWLAQLAGLVAIGTTAGRIGAPEDESRATAWVRACIWALAALIAVEGLLGALGLLRVAGPSLIGLGALAIGLRAALPGRFEVRRPERAVTTAADAGLAAALGGALAVRLAAGLHKTFFLYDTLSYHLHAPATWLADGRLSIVPSVFGDPAAAYAPANLELWFAFLMAPLRSDFLAGTGQLPFAALGALAIAAAAREAGARREAALGGALAFLLVPEVWQQARTAMTDLGMAALLLSTVPFLFRLRRAASTADLLAFAAALGLAIGTKYAAAPLAVPFAVALAVNLVRRKLPASRLAAAGALTLALGGSWYLRNTLVAHDPWYPVATLGFPGLYDQAAMRAWDYHLPVAELGLLAEVAGAAGFGFSAAALAAFARARPRVELALAAAVVAIFWLVIPYQESRFVLAGFGLAALAIGRAAAKPPAPLGWGGLALALIGECVVLPSPDRLALMPIGLLGAAALHGWRKVPSRARPALGWGVAAAAAASLLVGVARGLPAHRRGADPYRIAGDIDDAWRWFGANVHGARVAYTGTNLAFPLWGPDLSNRITYVNVSGGPNDRLPDFARRLGTGQAPTPEPAPYRQGPRYEDWARNLRAAGAQVLFVAALDPIVARTVAADADQFPIERQWADARPDTFQLCYASIAARVYWIKPP
ncbi:MAG TPA: glycosyltransferase family 39 protein [Polyangia bacterium]|nr:glycosyltransferase family 39 protein [Polyangia bacterium]